MKRVLTCVLVVAMLVSGFAANAVGDSGALTRGETLQYMFNYIKPYTFEKDCLFGDIDGADYKVAVIWGNEYGIVKGTKSKVFDGERHITRMETLTLLYRLVEKQVNWDGVKFVPDTGSVDGVTGIPEWAKPGVTFALENKFPGINQRDLALEKTVTPAELKLWLVKSLSFAAALISPFYPDETVEYSAVPLVNRRTGAKLNLGMTRDELYDILGVELENEWSNMHDGLNLGMFENKLFVSSILENSDWEIQANTGITRSDSRESVESAWGDADVFLTKGSAPIAGMWDVAIYQFDATGKRTTDTETAKIFVPVMYDDDSNIWSLSLQLRNPNPSPLIAINTPINGVIVFNASGDGNGSMTNTATALACLDILHTGDGAFSLKQGDAILFETSGAYAGRVFIPNLAAGNIEVVSEGGWRVKGLNPTPRLLPELFGNGDYVCSYMANTDKWNITHDGDGTFIVRLKYPATSQVETVVDTVGTFTGVIDVDADPATWCYVEIVADGNWTFTLAR